MPGTDRPPSFQFFPRDFISDPSVQALTLEELGAYIRLLCFAWMQEKQGYLDVLALSKLSGFNDNWAQHEQALSRCFDLSTPGLWIQKRMVSTRREQERNYRRAQAAAHARWTKERERQQHPSTGEGNALASASALESKKKEKDLDSVPRNDLPRPAIPARVPLAAGSFANAPVHTNHPDARAQIEALERTYLRKPPADETAFEGKP